MIKYVAGKIVKRLNATGAHFLIKAIGEITSKVDVFRQFDIHSISNLFSVEQKPELVISLEATEGESVGALLR